MTLKEKKALRTRFFAKIGSNAETGFFDQSHFTRVFKRERGLTPGEYRRQHLRR